MKLINAAILLHLVTSAIAAAPGTMRLDYYHTGTATEELFSLDRIVMEPRDPTPAPPATNPVRTGATDLR